MLLLILSRKEHGKYDVGIKVKKIVRKFDLESFGVR